LLRPLATSISGQCLLSTLNDSEIRNIIRRINAERAPNAPIVDIRSLLTKVDEIRERGYGMTSNSEITPGASVVAMVLPASLAQPSLVLGLGGTTELMMPEMAEIVVKMRSMIEECVVN